MKELATNQTISFKIANYKQTKLQNDIYLWQKMRELGLSRLTPNLSFRSDCAAGDVRLSDVWYGAASGAGRSLADILLNKIGLFVFTFYMTSQFAFSIVVATY